MKKLLFLLTAIALLASCQTEQPEITVEEQQKIADVIKAKVKFWVDSLAQNTPENFDRQLEMWVDDGEKAWVGEPALWLNMLYLFPDKESIKEVWNPERITRQSTNYTIEDEYVAVLSRESAVYVFKGNYSITQADGVTGPDYPLSGSYIFVLRDGDWKVIHNHQSWEIE